MRQINLLAGGPMAEWPEALEQCRIKGPWIGADRGNLRLLKLGITPRIAIGDFDSMTAAELAFVKRHVKIVHSYPARKNNTDTELLLMVALKELHAQQVRIYGATGGRIDHFLSNLFMVLQPRFRPFATRIKLIDRKNTVSFALPGSHRVNKENDKKYLAFVPLNAMYLSLSHVAYPLHHHWIGYARSYSSNEFIGSYARFSFDRGVMCVIQSRD